MPPVISLVLMHPASAVLFLSFLSNSLAALNPSSLPSERSLLGSIIASTNALGPIANLKIANKVIAPDGFSRSFVHIVFIEPISSFIQLRPCRRDISGATDHRLQSMFPIP